MDGNSVKGKSGVGTEVEISMPSSERIVALLGVFGLCTFLSIFMLPCCIAGCCTAGGLYSLWMPLSSK